MTEEIKDEELNKKLNGDNVEQVANEKQKKVKKEKLKPKSKYEKVKLRSLNFVAFILSLVVSIVLVAVVVYVAFEIISGIIGAGFNVTEFFDEKVFAVSLGMSGLFGGVLVVLLYGGVLLALLVCFYTVFYCIRTNINLGRLMFASDKDYMKNNLVYRAIYRGFWMLLLSLLLCVYFFTDNNKLLLKIGSIGSAVSLLAMIVLLFIDLIKARKRFKSSVSEEEYEAEIEYKRSINGSYFSRFARKSITKTNWTDLLHR